MLHLRSPILVKLCMFYKQFCEFNLSKLGINFHMMNLMHANYATFKRILNHCYRPKKIMVVGSKYVIGVRYDANGRRAMEISRELTRIVKFL